MPHGERFNVCSHLLGLLLAVPAAWWLLGKAAATGDAAGLAGVAVFLLTAAALYAASTAFHWSAGAARRWWERADHCAIYLLIAGSFTPFALAGLGGAGAAAVLAVFWGLAIFGVYRELVCQASAQGPPSPALYLGMGWACVLAAVPVAMSLSAAAVAWLLAGAACYTGGLVFYRNRAGWRHAHGTWHLFVLAGTGCHYASLLSVV